MRLITNCKTNTTLDSRKHADYRDVFLMACPEFTTADELFQIISRHFFDAEDDRNAEMRVGTQYKYKPINRELYIFTNLCIAPS